jgi:uncharacterized coiled-coil protein SlyX
MEHRVTKLETDMEHMSHSIDKLSSEVTELTRALERYRGAWGMLLMIGTAITGALTLFFKFKQ